MAVRGEVAAAAGTCGWSQRSLLQTARRSLKLSPLRIPQWRRQWERNVFAMTAPAEGAPRTRWTPASQRPLDQASKSDRRVRYLLERAETMGFPFSA